MNPISSKKTIFKNLAIGLLISGVFLCACKNDSKQTPAEKQQFDHSGQAITIAYVNTDSLWKSYEYVIDVQKTLKEEQTQKENQFQGMVVKLQSDFEQYLQTGASLSLNDQKAKETELQKREAQLGQQQEQIMAELTERRVAKNKILEEAIVEYILRYNKEHNYTFILEKTGISGVLYGDPAYDITGDIITGLNEEYKAKKPVEK